MVFGVSLKGKKYYRFGFLKLIFHFCFSLCTLLALTNISLYAQNDQYKYVITHNDSLALEKVIVENYYVSDSSDYNDSTKNSLPKGSITYRIFIDMKPGYNLQLVYGSPTHELFIETTTKFYNDVNTDALTGFNVDYKKLSNGNTALDSWITMGAAARGLTGIPRSEDTNGLSFITNRTSLKQSDGLCKAVLPDFQLYNLSLNFFNDTSNAVRFATNDGGWAAPGGVKGPSPENRVLIAQLTTNGKLSFELNVQIGTPNGGWVKFVAKNPLGSEIQFNGLNYKQL